MSNTEKNKKKINVKKSKNILQILILCFLLVLIGIFFISTITAIHYGTPVARPFKLK